MSNLLWDDIAIILSQSSLKMDPDEERSFSCGLCRRIMVDVRQIICGCKFCRRCIEKYVKDGNKKCPCDHDEDCHNVRLMSIDDVHVEKEANQRILKLTTQCSYDGCDYESDLIKMIDHFKSCDKRSANQIRTKSERNTEKYGLEVKIDFLRQHNEGLVQKVSSLTQQIDNYSLRICNLETQIKDFNNRNFYEPYIWKLENISKILSDRKNVYSDPFYVMKFGYKIRMAFAPGGNDGNWLGVYFQLMKGEYDPVLSWPFSFNITFTLLSQRLEHDDHVHTIDFPPEKNHLNSYLRPIHELNQGYGAQQFFNIDAFLSSDIYHSEDAFIKLSVSKV